MKRFLTVIATSLVAFGAASGLMLTSLNASAEGLDSDICYILREYNGRLALFTDGGDEPLTVYSSPLTSLYPGDLELLREGVRLKTRAEVARLLSDLSIDG